MQLSVLTLLTVLAPAAIAQSSSGSAGTSPPVTQALGDTILGGQTRTATGSSTSTMQFATSSGAGTSANSGPFDTSAVLSVKPTATSTAGAPGSPGAANWMLGGAVGMVLGLLG